MDGRIEEDDGRTDGVREMMGILMDREKWMTKYGGRRLIDVDDGSCGWIER